MMISGQRARAVLAAAHADLLDLERQFDADAHSAFRTRANLINFRIGLRIRLVLDRVDEPDVMRTATALDGRWRALQPRLIPNRAPGAFLVP